MEFTGERMSLEHGKEGMPWWSHHLARYVWALKYCFNKDVIDAACGTGYGSYLISSVAKSVTMVDKEEEAIKYAINTYKFNCSSSAIIGDLEITGRWLALSSSEENIGPDKFDTIVSFETIEHLDKPKIFLQWCKSFLRPQGQFIFSIPNMDGSAFHKRVYNLTGVKQLLEEFFTNIKWFGQTDCNILPVTENASYFIGICEV